MSLFDKEKGKFTEDSNGNTCVKVQFNTKSGSPSNLESQGLLTREDKKFNSDNSVKVVGES